MIRLNVLICDGTVAARPLQQALEQEGSISSVRMAVNVAAAQEALSISDVNTIFIDPLNESIDIVSEFVFGIRRSRPNIVFVLYMDQAKVEKQRTDFYRGERSRFRHYFTLDKRTPVAAFSDELRSVIQGCQLDISLKMSELSVRRLLDLGAQYGASTKNSDRMIILEATSVLFKKLGQESRPAEASAHRKKVFLSYRFADQEYVDGLTTLLEKNQLEVVTGRSSNTYISKAILDRIKSCDFFLCLMTKNEAKADGMFTTSAWLLEEKGAALAFGKPLVLMIEEGVTDFGGLQGDWQRIHFGGKGFLKAALEAVEQLKSYVG